MELKMYLEDPLATTFRQLDWGGAAEIHFHYFALTVIEWFYEDNRQFENQIV